MCSERRGRQPRSCAVGVRGGAGGTRASTPARLPRCPKPSAIAPPRARSLRKRHRPATVLQHAPSASWRSASPCLLDGQTKRPAAKKRPRLFCRKIKGGAHQPKGVFPRAVTFPVSRALPCAAAMEQFGADAITSFKGRYSFLSNYYKKAFSKAKAFSTACATTRRNIPFRRKSLRTRWSARASRARIRRRRPRRSGARR